MNFRIDFEYPEKNSTLNLLLTYTVYFGSLWFSNLNELKNMKMHMPGPDSEYSYSVVLSGA